MCFVVIAHVWRIHIEIKMQQAIFFLFHFKMCLWFNYESSWTFFFFFFICQTHSKRNDVMHIFISHFWMNVFFFGVFFSLSLQRFYFRMSQFAYKTFDKKPNSNKRATNCSAFCVFCNSFVTTFTWNIKEFVLRIDVQSKKKSLANFSFWQLLQTVTFKVFSQKHF